MKFALRSVFSVWVLGCFVGGCNAPESTTRDRPLPVRPAVPPAQVTPAVPPAARAVFDVPALLGLSIDQITTKLGKPVSDEQANFDASENDRKYHRQGYNLVVLYYVESRKARSFYLTPTRETKAYAQLLAAGNLQPNAAPYIVEPINEPTQRPGLVVTPKEETK